MLYYVDLGRMNGEPEPCLLPNTRSGDEGRFMINTRITLDVIDRTQAGSLKKFLERRFPGTNFEIRQCEKEDAVDILSDVLSESKLAERIERCAEDYIAGYSDADENREKALSRLEDS